jgi:flagellar basal body-associated protein FliL
MKNDPRTRGRANTGSDRPQYRNGNSRLTTFQLVLIFALVAFLVTAATSYIMYMIFMQKTDFFNVKWEGELGPMYSLPEFVVNLNEPDWPRYVRIKVILEARDKNALKQIQGRTPQIRDRIITTIRDKSVKDMENSQGLERLRVELREELDSILGDGRVVNLYFDGFVIQ